METTKKKILLAGKGLEDLHRILRNAGYAVEVVKDHSSAVGRLFDSREENDPDRYTAVLLAPPAYRAMEWNAITSGSE